MTPKNLFNIILKIFGLFFLREIVFIIPQLISSISFLIQPDSFENNQYSNYGIGGFIVVLIIIVFYCFIIYQLIFKANIIIDKLNLDKGFNQEEFSFHISTSLVLTIALIVIGGVILTEEIPNLCRNIFSYFQEKSLTHGMTKQNYSYIIFSAVKVIIGSLIIGERQRIVEFAEKRQTKKQVDKVDDEFDSTK
ncbi:MAG: hypothetical protein ABI419_12640 [Ginsengibacter sp.]